MLQQHFRRQQESDRMMHVQLLKSKHNVLRRFNTAKDKRQLVRRMEASFWPARLDLSRRFMHEKNILFCIFLRGFANTILFIQLTPRVHRGQTSEHADKNKLRRQTSTLKCWKYTELRV